MIEEHTDPMYDSTEKEFDETTDALDPNDVLAIDDPHEEDVESVVVAMEKNPSKESNTLGAPPSKDVLKLLNDSLMQEAKQARHQWELLTERIDKIKKSRGSIKESVYHKVATDYQNRIGEAQSEFQGLKVRVDDELVKLRHQEAEITREVIAHEDTLEEAQFRHELGEYTDRDYKAIANKEEAHLSRLKTQQDNLLEAIRQYEEIFSGIDVNQAISNPAESHKTVAEQPELREEQAPPPPPQPEEVPTAHPEEAAQEEVLPPPLPDVGAAGPRAVDRKGERVAKARSEPESPTVPTPTPEPVAPSKEVSPLKAETTEAKGHPTIVLYEKNKMVGQFTVEKELTIGRSPSNNIVLKELRVSRRHAVIRQSGSQYLLIDNNSSNGTYLNGEPITEHVLNSGDRLQIGSFELVFTV